MRRLFVPTVALCLALGGCGKKPAPASPAPSTAEAPRRTDAPATVDDGAAAAAAAAQREAARVRSVLEERVFFDYDEAQIRADAQGLLNDKSRILRTTPSLRIRIDGHADERGSTEYNLALGSRRATAVAAYLRGLGVEANQMETTTSGEERPLETGHDEAAWGRNRRAEFVILQGAPTMADGR